MRTCLYLWCLTAIAGSETPPCAEFGAWYDAYRADVLDPALATGLEALGAAMDEGLSDRDRSRIRSISGRVKSKRRTDLKGQVGHWSLVSNLHVTWPRAPILAASLPERTPCQVRACV